ncbi:hypothetical protein GLAREA_04349 [Glarea lozoyensis ATCC 20868]|uniref:Uncharacterized protein n=1 Tax=Glarea lozoyensis (strain ATCC 20868 / MF5171) TaxID=1116229 RepID=S3DM03_GLAL2|nr:uncharacterized protein GLAREA_04349 [Glarea lozoyensis ATCC 20868]EPE27558.1 hypothetical protein GLAREA_04349 [Glarea lozoyensis ATCC 20868]
MEPPTIKIELEVDNLKNQELGSWPSKPAVAEDGFTNLEAGDAKGSGSYLSVQLTTIQAIDSKHSLFVWHTVYHPGVGRRFQSAVLVVKLSQKPSSPASVSGNIASSVVPPVRIQQHAPRKAFGGTAEESKTVHWGLELPLTVSVGPVGIGVTPCTERKSAVEVDHAFVIEGSVRGIPQKHTCVWTVEENKATERGVPSEVRFAALIEHSQPIICEVSASGWTAGGLKPSHHLKTKTPKEARSLEVDPSQYKGKLVEFELGQDISQYQELLSSWTGKVEGALLEFDQTVVGP